MSSPDQAPRGREVGEPVQPQDPAPEAGYGASLRAAREAAGLTVEQVSARTNVRPALVRALEDEAPDGSLGPVYARGHLRALAAAVGTDAAPLLAAFDARVGRPAGAAGAGAAPVGAPLGRPAPGGPGLRVPSAERPDRRAPRWALPAVAALAVLVALLAVGVATGGHGATGPAAAVLGPGPSPSARPAPARPLPSTAVAQLPHTAGAVLRVRVTGGASWISVSGAKGVLFEGVLADGSAARDFSDASQLRLVVGNAGAVSVVCGSKDLAPAGGAGSVRRFTCTAGGLVPA